MAGIGASQMGSAIGGFFGDDKLKQKYYNPELGALFNTEYIDALKKLRTSGEDATAQYSQALKAATPQAQEISNMDVADLGSLIRGSLNYDPVASYERIREGNLGALNAQAANLADYGSRGDKLALAARGYGGRGDGAYERILRQDRISRNIAPVIGGIFNNLGQDSSIAENNRFRNLLSYLQLMRERSGVPDRLAERALYPAEAQASLLGREIAIAGGLGQASRNNSAGFQLKKNKWKNFFEQTGSGIDEAADTAIQAAMTYYGGGMAGGMMGGGGGGGMSTGGIARGAAMSGAMGQSSPSNYWTLSPNQQNQYFNQWRWAQGIDPSLYE